MSLRTDSASGPPESVSVLGLGPMGTALASALLRAGHRTTVWNRTPARADALVAQGAARAATAAEAVAASSLTLVCLMDDAAVRATLALAADALGGRALGGRALANLTSTSPEQARATAAWAADRGADYLDGAILTPTPLIGQPQAIVLYSGPEHVFQAHRHTLASLGAAAYLGDDAGRAAGYDVALLDIFWTSVVGLAHGLAVARAEGISGAEIAGYARAVFGLLPEMATRFGQQLDTGRHPGERSTIASAAATIKHIIHTAQANHIDASVLTASQAILERAVEAGHGADGLSRLAETLGKPLSAG